MLAAESAPDKAAKESELARRTMLPRFVKQLVLTIADQVRTVVINSVGAFANFWINKFEGGDAAIEGIVEQCLPLIEVKLVVRDGDAALEPPLEQVCDTMLAIFDDVVTSGSYLNRAFPFVIEGSILGGHWIGVAIHEF